MTTPTIHAESRTYPYLVVIASTVKIPRANMTAGILWDDKVYPPGDLPKIEKEYNRIMFSGRRAC